MNALHYLDTVGRGGAEAQALDVCRNAANFGIKMTLVSGGGGGFEDEFRTSGAEYIRLDRKFPVDPFLALKIRKIIKERNIKVVQGYQPVDGLHLYLATRGMPNVKTVLSFQGFIQDRKNRETARFLISRMDANIVVSRGLQEWLRSAAGLDSERNFSVLYNGADPERLRPIGRSLRSELAIPKSSTLIGMVGNFYRDPRKDQMTVCRAIGKVFAMFPEVHCVFAGGTEPGAEAKLAECQKICSENGIADRVHFVGSRTDVSDILAELDVFIFSSLHEGLPLAVSEAMLAGVPMIVSDIEPLLEATDNGRVAGIFPVGNADLLAGELITFLSDDGLRKRYATDALAFARDNFSIDAHLTQLTALYRSLLES